MPRNTPGTPDVPSSVTPQEAHDAIPHKEVAKMVKEALYETGAAGKDTVPYKERWNQSGTHPSDESQYFIGTDRRIYGKGQKMPEGVSVGGFVQIVVESLGDEYYARVLISKDGPAGLEDAAISNSSMGDPIPLDPDDPKSAPERYKWQSLKQFATKDPKTAVRQALVDLQGNGRLFDPTASLYKKKPIPKILPGVLLATLMAAVALLAWLAGGRGPSPAAPPSAPEGPKAVRNADGSVTLGDRQYYVVYGNDRARDTGTEVCASIGKTCVGYTDLTTSVCQSVHPGAEVKSDLDGSSAGFFCNGAPQGGVCGKETNTCHICPQCNLNMDCAMEVGVLYAETYVQCR
ncbi:MAG: hypothetical protein RL272_33 [Candidatus Parcubacteria bacterium]|jgi:hypothetical protein